MLRPVVARDDALGRRSARLIPAMVAIFAMLALGFVTKASGMDVVLGSGLHANRADALSRFRDAPGVAWELR